MILTHLSQGATVALALRDRPVAASEAAHLAACTACRRRLQETRAIRDMAMAARDVNPRLDLLQRIQTRIHAGEQIILPSESPVVAGPGSVRSSRWLATAVAAALFVVVWTAIPPSNELVAGSTSGEMSFSPATPLAGDTIRVVYRAPSDLSREATLRLRGRLRSAWDDANVHHTRQDALATLQRGADGLFRATLVLPDTTEFIVLAVENPSATHVDSHHRQLWEILAHGRDGKPTYEALRQRENDLMGRNASLAFQAARDRVKYYPNQPKAWANLFFEESINLGERSSGDLAAHRERLLAFHRRWETRRDTPFAIASGILAYTAQAMDDSDVVGNAIRARWRPEIQRLTDHDPRDFEGAEERWVRINRSALRGADSARFALPAAERFWQGAGQNLPVGAMVGAQVARLANDSGELRRIWLDRYANSNVTASEYMYHEMGTIPALRRDAAKRLADLAEGLLTPNDARRPLELSRREAASSDSARARITLGLLGDVLLDMGDSLGARAAYERATSAGWNVALFGKAAAAQLATGDSARAAASLAKVAIDPGTQQRLADSLAARGRGLVGARRWTALSAEAQTVMRDYFLASSVRERPAGQIHLYPGGGAATDLATVQAGRVSVVTFWSKNCGPSRAQTPLFDGLAARLRTLNATLIPITSDAPSAAETSYLAVTGVHVPVYYDRDGSARGAFNQWSTPEYYVLDSTGKIRFRDSAPDVVLAQVMALTAQGRASSTGHAIFR